MTTTSSLCLPVSATVDQESKSRGFDPAQVYVQLGTTQFSCPTQFDRTFIFYDCDGASIGDTVLLSRLINGSFSVDITANEDDTRAYFASRSFQPEAASTSKSIFGPYQLSDTTQNNSTMLKDITSSHKVSLVVKHFNTYRLEQPQYAEDIEYVSLPDGYQGLNSQLCVSCQLGNN